MNRIQAEKLVSRWNASTGLSKFSLVVEGIWAECLPRDWYFTWYESEFFYEYVNIALSEITALSKSDQELILDVALEYATAHCSPKDRGSIHARLIALGYHCKLIDDLPTWYEQCELTSDSATEADLLMLAINRGDLASTSFLLDKQVTSYWRNNPEYFSPCTYAVCRGKRKIVEILLDRGHELPKSIVFPDSNGSLIEELDWGDVDGVCPFSFPTFTYLILTNAKTEILELFQSNNCFHYDNNRNNTAHYLACCSSFQGLPKQLSDMLPETVLSAMLQEPNALGRTPIHLAVMCGNWELLEEFLDLCPNLSLPEFDNLDELFIELEPPHNVVERIKTLR